MASRGLHHFSGLCLGLPAVVLSPTPLGLGFLMGAVLGSTAPDWLEIARPVEDSRGQWHRTSIIPHRTITHWAPIWVLLALAGAVAGQWTGMLLLGFALGGLMHLLLDWPNPMGLPGWNPMKRKKGLSWWKSGEREIRLGLLMVCVSTMTGGLAWTTRM